MCLKNQIRTFDEVRKLTNSRTMMIYQFVPAFFEQLNIMFLGVVIFIFLNAGSC